MTTTDEIARLRNEVATIKAVCGDLREAIISALGVAVSGGSDPDKANEFFDRFEKIMSEINDKLDTVRG